jgi:EmrB/QacA subfamily drug resistance transporter
MEDPDPLAFTRSTLVLIWLVAAGFFMQALDSTIVNTALPSMARSLHESPLRMQSVIIGYSLTLALLIPASGWLADRFGTRSAYLAALLLFVLGSALCAAAPTLSVLVAARVLQGTGGAMLLPVGRLAVLRTVPRAQFLQAISMVTIPGLVGPLIGPTLGGWLSEYSSWHWIFLINLPIGLVGALATLKFMPQSRPVGVERFDFSGFAMIAVAMVTISLALDGVSELHFQLGAVMLLFVFGLAALSAYWLHAAQHAQPLFSPALFGIPTFSIGLLGNLFARIGVGSMPFLLPLMLQVGLAYTPAQAGVMLIPSGIAAIIGKWLVAPLIARRGYRRVLVANTALLGACIVSLGLVDAGQPLWLRVAQLALFGAVNSVQFTVMNTLTLKDLTPELASSGNSLLSMVQMSAMSFGVAAAAALLTSFTQLLGAAHTDSVLGAFHASFLTLGLVTIASAWIFGQLSGEVRGHGEREETVDVPEA